MPEGACSGIGFGCSLYGWDAVGVADLIFGIPFAVMLAVILGVLSLPSIRRPWLTVAVATTGFALPWLLAVAVVLPLRHDPVVEDIEVVVAHRERATLRVGDVFLKIDTDQARIDRELEVMARAPIPIPDVLWRQPPVLALAAVPGTALGRLHEPSPASPAAWVAAGAAIRALHDAPPPPWPSSQCQQLPARTSRGAIEFPQQLDTECEWLVANDVVSAEVVLRNRRIAEAALRPWTPVFIHGDLQIVHVFVDGDEITGVVDWSEGGQGDAMYDLATLTLAHEERLHEVVAGYGREVDIDVIRAYWSLRSLMATRWLAEHGYGAPATFPEVAVLNALAADS